MVASPTSSNPIGYLGIDPKEQPRFFRANRTPTQNDYLSFELGDQWLDESVTPPDLYILKSVRNRTAIWQKFGGLSTNFPADAILIGDGTTVPKTVGPLTDGQVLIGSTGNEPVLATLTAGTNVTIDNAPGSVTINSTGGLTTPFTEDAVLIGDGTTTPVTFGPLTDGQVIVGSTGNPPALKTLTDGQVLIGSTGNEVQNATLTAGTNITITDGPGSITIDSATGLTQSALTDFTPKLIIASSPTTPITYTEQIGKYVKTGNLVHIIIRLKVNAFSPPSLDQMSIIDLPFPIVISGTYRPVFPCIYGTFDMSLGSSIACEGQPGTSTLTPIVSNGPADTRILLTSDFLQDSTISLTGSYLSNAP